MLRNITLLRRSGGRWYQTLQKELPLEQDVVKLSLNKPSVRETKVLSTLIYVL